MFITVITGIIGAFLIIFSLLYPLFKRQKRFVSLKKLKFHCISGCLSIVTILVHIHFSFNFTLSSGNLSLVVLITAIISGVIKKYIMRSKIAYTVHLILITALTLLIIYHFFVNAINLLFL